LTAATWPIRLSRHASRGRANWASASRSARLAEAAETRFGPFPAYPYAARKAYNASRVIVAEPSRALVSPLSAPSYLLLSVNA
jgi:hypothetical protein